MERTFAHTASQLAQWLGLVVTVGPAIGAWIFKTPLDSYPRWLCLGLGLLVSGAIAAYRFQRARRTEQRAAVEQHRDHSKLSARQRKKKRKGRASSNRSPKDPPAAQAAPAGARGRMGSVARMLLYLGPPCWCLAGGMYGNRLLDRSPPQVHRVALVSVKAPYKGAQVIVVESWRFPGGLEQITRDSFSMATVHAGVPVSTPLDVVVRGGALGWPYVEAIRLARSP